MLLIWGREKMARTKVPTNNNGGGHEKHDFLVVGIGASAGGIKALDRM